MIYLKRILKMKNSGRQLLSTSLLLCASLNALPVPAANAADDKTLKQNEIAALKRIAASTGSKSEADANAAELSLTVDDINDLGFALQRIRQQAINIYVEATRKRAESEISAQIPNLNAVPTELPKEQSKLLPFRRPWLVYFITTLEPLVHLLKEDLKEVESGARKIDVTPEQRKALDPYLKEWAVGVNHLDECLVHSAELIEDAGKNNVALAKLASDLDKEVVKLEQVREKAFDVVEAMRQAEKNK